VEEQPHGRPITISGDLKPKEGKSAVRFDSQVRSSSPSAAGSSNRTRPGTALNGLAFQVKGDGSANFGCIRLQAGSYDKAWISNFPLKDTAWHEVKLAWKDFVPGRARRGGTGRRRRFRPGDVNLIAFGKSWNFTTKHEQPKLRLLD